MDEYMTEKMNKGLGAATYTFLYKESIFSAIENLAESGFRIMELTATPPHVDIDNFDKQSRKQLRVLASSKGVEIFSVNPTYLDLNLASLNSGIRKETTRQLRLSLQLCNDLEAKLLVLFGGRRHVLIPAPLEIVKRIALEELHGLLDYASELGVKIGLENGPALLFQTGSDLAEAIQLSSHPNLGAVFDVANGHMVEDPAEGLTAVMQYVALVHLSDTTRDKWAHKPAGDGDVQFDKIDKVLNAAGYIGPSILEVIDMDDPINGLQRSADKLKQYGWSS